LTSAGSSWVKRAKRALQLSCAAAFVVLVAAVANFDFVSRLRLDVFFDNLAKLITASSSIVVACIWAILILTLVTRYKDQATRVANAIAKRLEDGAALDAWGVKISAHNSTPAEIANSQAEKTQPYDGASSANRVDDYDQDTINYDPAKMEAAEKALPPLGLGRSPELLIAAELSFRTLERLYRKPIRRDVTLGRSAVDGILTVDGVLHVVESSLMGHAISPIPRLLYRIERAAAIVKSIRDQTILDFVVVYHNEEMGVTEEFKARMHKEASDNGISIELHVISFAQLKREFSVT